MYLLILVDMDARHARVSNSLCFMVLYKIIFITMLFCSVLNIDSIYNIKIVSVCGCVPFLSRTGV